MKHLIQHLLKHNMPDLMASSFLNCHVHGLHSIMLIDKPGSRIRMYVAESDCVLKDCIPEKIKFSGKLPLGFHAHHCDLTFEVVKGTLINWKVWPSNYGGEFGGYKAYRFKSPILEEKGGFELVSDNIHIITHQVEKLYTGMTSVMRAEEIHTVAMDYGQSPVSWLVYEGKENDNFSNLTFSNVDLEKGSFDGLYIKPDQSDIERIIKMSGILEYNEQPTIAIS